MSKKPTGLQSQALTRTGGRCRGWEQMDTPRDRIDFLERQTGAIHGVRGHSRLNRVGHLRALHSRFRPCVLLALCICCPILATTRPAIAGYVGIVTETSTNPDCPDLSICRVYALFDNTGDQLLSIGNSTIITDAPGGFFQDPLNPNGDTSPPCPLTGTLACDSFVTIDVNCDPGPPSTNTDPDWNSGAFNNNGQIFGGWVNGNVPVGQGNAGNDPAQNRVLIAQLTVETGYQIAGVLNIFWREANTGLTPGAPDCFNCGPDGVALLGVDLDCGGEEDCPTVCLPFKQGLAHTESPNTLCLGNDEPFVLSGPSFAGVVTRLAIPEIIDDPNGTGITLAVELSLFSPKPAIDTIINDVLTSYDLPGCELFCAGASCSVDGNTAIATAIAITDSHINTLSDSELKSFPLPPETDPVSAAGMGICIAGNVIFQLCVETTGSGIECVSGVNQSSWTMPQPSEPIVAPPLSWTNGQAMGLVVFTISRAFLVTAGETLIFPLPGDYVGYVPTDDGLVVLTTDENVPMFLTPGVTIVEFGQCDGSALNEEIAANMAPCAGNHALVTAGWPPAGLSCARPQTEPLNLPSPPNPAGPPGPPQTVTIPGGRLGSCQDSDCNDNGVPDFEDIDPSDPDGDGTVSADDNGNGIPDECDDCVFDIDCDDENQCTEDLCVDGFCYHCPFPLSTPCEEDADQCTIEHCDGAGACIFLSNVSIDDENACTDDACDSDTGEVTHVDNYDPDTECCDPETGESTPIDDKDACTDDACDPDTGLVSHTPVECPDGEVCDAETGKCISECGPCPTDVDGSGNTGASDLAVLLGSWGPCAPGDACECLDDNGDGLIGAADLAVLLGSWGPCE